MIEGAKERVGESNRERMNEWKKERKRERERTIHEDCVRVKSKFVKGNYYIRKSGVKEKIWKLRRNREREREREFNSQRKMITFC